MKRPSLTQNKNHPKQASKCHLKDDHIQNKALIILNDIQLPQQKSKSIQDAYDVANAELRDTIFNNDINDNIISFCVDKYQHYIIQCILEKGSIQHKNIITKRVIQNINILCEKKYAYKIVQACLSNIDELEDINFIYKYILDNVRRLQFDQYGNLVIGTMLETLKNDDMLTQLINRLQLDKLKYHQYGCVVLIKMVTLRHQHQIEQIINKLIKESFHLSQSQYSNYIIQKMLTERLIDKNKILINDYLIPNFVELACNKFGSNVCEIMLAQSLAYQLQFLWNSIIKHNLSTLLNDEYANYVMQTYFYYIQLFSYIVEDFEAQLMDLNKRNYLNQNGKIVFKYVLQCKQTVQQSMPSRANYYY